MIYEYGFARKSRIIMRHSIFLMNLEFLYQCIVSMPLISEVL